MSLPVIDAGVDWITATHAREGGTSPLWYLGNSQVQHEHKAGNDLRSWRWNGYNGYSAGQAAVGQRADGVILRLSGAVAASYWRAVAQLATNVSRLDVQATVRDESATNDWAREAWLQFIRAHGRQGRPGNADLITSSPAGQTAMLGSRASERYARVYDKAAESGDPKWAGCWRYELELKAKTAYRAATRLLLVRDTANAATALVHQHLEERGVLVPFQRAGSFSVETIPKRPTDQERRLQWLRTQVAPCIAALIDDGLEDAVLGALGLGPVPDWLHDMLVARLPA